MYFNRAEPHATELISGEKNRSFFILTSSTTLYALHTSEAWFWNGAEVLRLINQRILDDPGVSKRPIFLQVQS